MSRVHNESLCSLIMRSILTKCPDKVSQSIGAVVAFASCLPRPYNSARRSRSQVVLPILQKPCNDTVLLEAIDRALHRAQRAWHDHVEQHTLHERLETSTPREHEVFACVVTGMLNKQIAHTLGVSEKTVKVHRGRVMQKMHAISLVELVRMADKVGLRPPCHTA